MRTFAAIIGFTALLGCSNSTNGGAEDFSRLAEEFVYGSLALSPVTATAAGYHRHNGAVLDEQIDDLSRSGIEKQRAFFNGFRKRLQRIQQDRLAPEDSADFRIISDQISLSLLELDVIQNFRHNPTLYVELAGNALNTPYTLEFAPKLERYRAIIARMKRLPQLFDDAKTNLVDAPEVWNRVAQQENDGNISLIDQTLRQNCPPELKSEFDQAAGVALSALRDFNGYLKTQLSQRISDWRLGKEKYAQKFRYSLEIDAPPEDVLAEAEEQLRQIRASMAEIAKPQTVEAALNKIAQKHAAPDAYFDAAKRDLAEATRFVRDKKLLTLPSGANLQVIPTPEFMRGIYAVGGFNPAPALEPQLGAYFWITPIPQSWPKDRAESKLREYNFYGLKLLTLHEAMPGHYVQFEFADQVQPKSRRLVRSVFGNQPYIEGWAVYATEMMIDEGYYRDDPGMQLTWRKQLLRAIANTILDVRMHTQGMTDQQALDLMIKDTYQEKEEAAAKLQRAQLSSCQLPTYFVGWRAWLRDRDRYRQKKGHAFQLAEFHDRALREGAVPLPALWPLLARQ
jgi:uncharacterized protein (DUF885 family)